MFSAAQKKELEDARAAFLRSKEIDDKRFIAFLDPAVETEKERCVDEVRRVYAQTGFMPDIASMGSCRMSVRQMLSRNDLKWSYSEAERQRLQALAAEYLRSTRSDISITKNEELSFTRLY